MKKLFGFIIAILFVKSFSFHKLEAPYYYYIPGIGKIDPKNIDNENGDCAVVIFIYEENTGHIISHTSYECKDLKKIDQFFRCKTRGIFCDSNPSFIFISEQPGIHLNNICKKERRRSSIVSCTDTLELLTQNSNLFVNFFDFILKNSIEEVRASSKYQAIKLLKSFTTSEGICIRNKKKGITLCKGKESIDFEKAFIKYINETIIYYTIIKKIKPYTYDYLENGKKSLAAYEVSEAEQKINFWKQKLDFLDSNTILSIYTIFKDHENQETILWGLAENKKTKARFHWMTNLENNISVLVDQVDSLEDVNLSDIYFTF